MTGLDFASYIRFKTRTNSTTFTTTEIILLANVVIEELAPQILEAQEDILLIPHTTNLIATGGDAVKRLYPFPTTILARIKRVEAKFDGTNWINLTEFDINQYHKPSDETSILAQFSNAEGKAKYDIGRKALRIFSGEITAVAAGLKLWLNTYPAKLQPFQLEDNVDLSIALSSTTHGMPQEFHELWARRVGILYKASREKPIPLDEQELKYELDLKEAIITLRHGNDDREVFAPLPPASDRGNHGQNY